MKAAATPMLGRPGHLSLEKAVCRGPLIDRTPGWTSFLQTETKGFEMKFWVIEFLHQKRPAKTNLVRSSVLHLQFSARRALVIGDGPRQAPLIPVTSWQFGSPVDARNVLAATTATLQLWRMEVTGRLPMPHSLPFECDKARRELERAWNPPQDVKCKTGRRLRSMSQGCGLHGNLLDPQLTNGSQGEATVPRLGHARVSTTSRC